MLVLMRQGMDKATSDTIGKAFKNEIDDNDALTRELTGIRQEVVGLEREVKQLRDETTRLRVVIFLACVIAAISRFV